MSGSVQAETTFRALSTLSSTDLGRVSAVAAAPVPHRHVHALDLPFRLTSTWQDRGCVLGTWERRGRLLAWALFQPPWQNLDYATVTSERGSSFTSEVLTWGVQQIEAHAVRTNSPATGSVELLADTPGVARTVDDLVALGFARLDWDTIRFAVDPSQTRPPRASPPGYLIRPTNGGREEQAYVELVQAVFGAGWMTESWRRRMTEHPVYRRELDLVAVDRAGALAGFCLCWLEGDVAQIEPIGVHPEHQGRGLGAALERVAADAARRLGARLLTIDHGGTNDGAIAMSRRVGFRQVGRILRFGKEGADG